MLTRENFKDTWGRLKDGGKGIEKEKKEEDMVVDGSIGDGGDVEMEGVGNGAHEEEIMKDTIEENVMREDNGKIINGNTKDFIMKDGNRRTSTTKMPIFGFQHRGIGAVKSKRQYQKPKQKK